jgi:hypothetical protein
MARARRDAARLLLEAPAAVARSQVHASLAEVLERAGLVEAEAFETATMMLSAVLVGALRAAETPATQPAGPLVLAIDTGSRGVSLRAGSEMTEVIRAAHDRSGFPPAVIRGERVIVRRLRGGRRAELELNPVHPWRVHVHAPTWNTRLDLLGLDVRGIHVDSGAVRVDCLLPPPCGSVPIHVSSGVVGLRLRRPPGVGVVADVSPGSVQLRLDDTVLAATTADARWTSDSNAAVSDHYALKISSGTVRVSLEQDPTLNPRRLSPPAPHVEPQPGVAAALEVVLDGVAARRAR